MGRISQSLLQELKFEADSTRKLFEAIPEDALDYKPNDFNWTIAELASHTAEIYNWWSFTLNKNVLELNDYNFEVGELSSMTPIKAKLEKNIAIAIESLTDYPDEKFDEHWSMQKDGMTLIEPTPRLLIVRSFLMNHLYHHRGELVAYLRAAGKKVPGLYGPTYEEQEGLT